MSLLLDTVFRSVCHGTHERLAVDALRHLRCADADAWCDLILYHHGEYLAGSVAPDERFKDFGNHVIYVGNDYWGGAPGEARRWYERTRDALRRREWTEAIFAAGALSHYVADPFMPLHTARTEEDTRVHRALEWSICHSYGQLQQVIVGRLGSYPCLETPRSEDWLERMVLTGAELAHPHYEPVLQHYDLDRAARDPLAGMDAECQWRIAECLAHAVVAFARVLERAITEAEVEPPPVETTLAGFLAAASSPLRWLMHHGRNLNEHMAIDALRDEVHRTGKVVKNLAEDDREIRRLHAEEVLRVPLHQLDQQPAGLTGTLHSSTPADAYSNRLISTSVLPTDRDVSEVWRAAQRRLADRRQKPAARALVS